jgi:hypothetical protein
MSVARGDYRPGLQDQPWGREMSVLDGNGNKLIFIKPS